MFEYGPSKLEQLKVIIKMILGGENMELFIRRTSFNARPSNRQPYSTKNLQALSAAGIRSFVTNNSFNTDPPGFFFVLFLAFWW